MDTSVTRRWLLANVIGMVVGMLLFGAIADSGWADEPKLLNVAAHLVGFLAFGSLLAYLQRWALGARRTSFVTWAAVLAVVQFLAFGLAFEIFGPPLDFVVSIVALGATTGLLVRREAVRPHPRWLAVKGALAGVAAVVGMIPVFVVADPINDAMGGGFAPFMVILALIGAVCGVALGALLRPAGTVATAA
jgi:hypothetical protein